jgi:hypothetical protein
MTKYMISFAEGAMIFPEEELPDVAEAAHAVVQEARDAGVWVFGAGRKDHSGGERPIYHHKRDSIEAHLTIVFTAPAVSRWLERRTGWSIKKLVTTLRRYHTIDIQARRPGRHRPRPLPEDVQTVLDQIHDRTN